MVQKIALLALAGSLGTLARYGLAGVVQRATGASFPWGTLVVNLLGCFLAGLLWVLFESRWPVSGQTRAVVLVGFLGAFTTFSAYILETGNLARGGEWLHAAANLGLQNVLGIVALMAGIALARLV
ncbi:MAG: CrcB family protein [Proteobacteria bacterium]|nr:CrcB family protein [Pseudomonadota bacterium]